MTSDDQKRAAALAALEFVEPGMKLGLGTGSTAAHFIDLLGDRAKGWALICVPTSEKTARQARKRGLVLTTLDETPRLDLTVDGADELDDRLDLIKGGGGALLREKIVAASSRQMIVIADGAKQVAMLGRFPLPVEIVPFGAAVTIARIGTALRPMGRHVLPALRMRDGQPFVTDNGNYVVDLALERIERPADLAALLSGTPGVVEHGLFIGMASIAIIGAADGVRILRR
ncbi:MAG: ribose-5-phosphate isomerase RpiA [Pseudomonadota bacterium]|nr:ribose-5-phosphate isomerase RpiA [Pseudomonadota bacterium]